ncbi:hypothetical protein [Roseibium sp.]|uniref:hypothetical protein n=1 Tax=Roseibium sp. TaxID=1936156 RepID=UPI003BA8803E
MHATLTSRKEMEVGAKLGAIIQDATAREQLIESPEAVLSEIGAKSDVTIYADTADLVHLIIPAEVDQTRVAADDEAYFEELGLAALGSCYYEDLPE